MAQSPLRPLTLEILSPGAAELLYSVGATEPARFRKFARHWSVVTSFAGTENVLERCEREFRQMAERARATAFAPIEEEQPRSLRRPHRRVRLRRAGIVARARRSSRSACLPTNMRAILDAAAKAAEAAALPWAALARGVGVIYFALLPSRAKNEHAPASLRRTKYSPNAPRSSGNADDSVVPGRMEGRIAESGGRRAAILDQMRKLKKVFDPQRNLCAGVCGSMRSI